MAVGFSEPYDAGRREGFEKACYSPGIRLTPAVNRLVLVSHGDHPAGLRGEERDELLLDRVRVLELVDQQLTNGAPAGFSYRRMVAEQLGREQQKVVQIERAD